MKTKIICKPSKGLHTFYLVTEQGRYFLFNQNYRRSVQEYYGQGVPLTLALDHSKCHRDYAVRETMDKLPMYIKYIEKEYGISVLNHGKSRKGHKKNAKYRYDE